MAIDLTLFRTEFLPAAAFAERAFAALEAIPDTAQVHRRSGAVKYLSEEILPIAIFARYFDMPERRVECRYLGESDDDADGVLRLNGRAVELGFYPQRILLEVTCAEDSKAYLRREALARLGGVFTGMDIERSAPRSDPSSRIVSRPEVREGGSGIYDMATLVRAAIEKKVGKNYSPQRLLLVRIDPDFHLTHSALCKVADRLQVPDPSKSLLSVFLVDCSLGCVFQV